MAALVSRSAISDMALGHGAARGNPVRGQPVAGHFGHPHRHALASDAVGDPGDDLGVLVGSGVTGSRPCRPACVSAASNRPSSVQSRAGIRLTTAERQTVFRSRPPQPTKPDTTQRRPKPGALSFAPIANIAAGRRPCRGSRRVCRRAVWHEPSRSAPAGCRPPHYRLGEPMHAVPGASRRYSMRRVHCPETPQGPSPYGQRPTVQALGWIINLQERRMIGRGSRDEESPREAGVAVQPDVLRLQFALRNPECAALRILPHDNRRFP